MGIFSSLALMFWIGIGTQVSRSRGFLKLVPKPYSIEGCRVLNTTESLYEGVTAFVLTTTTASSIAQV